MRLLNLFDGIGGFALAAEWMGWENVGSVEIDPFCRQVLDYWFDYEYTWKDIKAADFVRLHRRIDIITGGFPCQPFSNAGKQRGKDDDRYLWPEMLRAIREVQPRWVVGENVRGLLTNAGAWYSSRCALTWKLSATKCNRYLFQLAPSMRPTGGTGCGLSQDLLPTPRATEIVEHPARQAQRLGDRTGTKLNNLSSGAKFGLLPTPTATDSGSGRVNRSLSPGAAERPTIAMAARMGLLPTPLATDIPHPEKVRKLREAGVTLRSTALGKRSNMGMTDFLDYHGLLPTPNAIEGTKGTRTYNPNSQNGRGLSAMACSGMLPSPDANRGKDGSESRRIGHASQLNPLFVTEMMGYPLGWLVSPFRNGGANHSNASETR